MPFSRPKTTVVLAMSADGKISDSSRSPLLFGSPNDKAFLEEQLAAADAVLAGAGTLRSGGTALTVTNPQLLQQRFSQGKPAQPIQIICSATANINPQLRFFSQSFPHWLLTTTKGAENWPPGAGFDQILIFETPEGRVDLTTALHHLGACGIQNLAVFGGGGLIASMMAAGLIDEFLLTVCPLILGGVNAPTPVDGDGFFTPIAPRLQLLQVKPIGDEVFLHYRLQR